MPNDSDRYPLIDAMRIASERSGVSLDYNRAWKLIAAGRVPAERVGRRWYVRKEQQAALETALGLATPAVA